MSSALRGEACGERSHLEVGASTRYISRALGGPSHKAMSTSLAAPGQSPGCWVVYLTWALTGVEELLPALSNSGSTSCPRDHQPRGSCAWPGLPECPHHAEFCSRALILIAPSPLRWAYLFWRTPFQNKTDAPHSRSGMKHTPTWRQRPGSEGELRHTRAEEKVDGTENHIVLISRKEKEKNKL